ncbi:hypothetical protein [Geothrix sp. 21YS21S-2]|uniref:hypothetical protein n=1 Tax=Geothrix sp. 21YS21S-2 TaxID=3068893 RepID=UPI0027B8C106|nr:hypothetical protein [Geothrix sp. 21YS21S-2]
MDLFLSPYPHQLVVICTLCNPVVHGGVVGLHLGIILCYLECLPSAVLVGHEEAVLPPPRGLAFSVMNGFRGNPSQAFAKAIDWHSIAVLNFIAWRGYLFPLAPILAESIV